MAFDKVVEFGKTQLVRKSRYEIGRMQFTTIDYIQEILQGPQQVLPVQIIPAHNPLSLYKHCPDGPDIYKSYHSG